MDNIIKYITANNSICECNAFAANWYSGKITLIQNNILYIFI